MKEKTRQMIIKKCFLRWVSLRLVAVSFPFHSMSLSTQVPPPPPRLACHQQQPCCSWFDLVWLCVPLNVSFYVKFSCSCDSFTYFHFVSAAAMWSLVRPCVAVVPSSSQLQIKGSRPLLLRAPPFQSAHHSEAEQALWLSPVCHRRWSRQAAILCLGRSTSEEERERRGREGKRRWEGSCHLTSVSISWTHLLRSRISVTEFSNTKLQWIYFHAKSTGIFFWARFWMHQLYPCVGGWVVMVGWVIGNNPT